MMIIAGCLFLLLATASFIGWYWLAHRDSLSTAKNDNPGEAIGQGNTSKPSPPEGMVAVSGGSFRMGLDNGEYYEKPAHLVEVKPFYMDTYEVTCAEYKQFMDATGHAAPQGWVQGAYPAGADRVPVTGVSWDDANAYAQWVKKRLPTEEEWEFAGRGNDGRLFPWGNEWKPGAANDAQAHRGRAVAVGSFPEGKGPFGVFDMAGNVWEWTSSVYAPYPGGGLTKAEGRRSQREDVRVIRGGCYENPPAEMRSTFRTGWPARGARYPSTGFRCVKDILK